MTPYECIIDGARKYKTAQRVWNGRLPSWRRALLSVSGVVQGSTETKSSRSRCPLGRRPRYIALTVDTLGRLYAASVICRASVAAAAAAGVYHNASLLALSMLRAFCEAAQPASLAAQFG